MKTRNCIKIEDLFEKRLDGDKIKDEIVEMANQESYILYEL